MQKLFGLPVMRFIVPLLLLFASSCCFEKYFLWPTEKFNIFQIKSISCVPNPEFVQKLFCRIKPTRDRKGLTTVLITPKKPFTDIWAHVVIWYKYGMIFRPWMIDVDADICGPLGGSLDSPLVIFLALRSMQMAFPDVVHKCPYNETHGYENADLDTMFSNMLPQVIPDGEYKALLRLHTRKNETMYTVSGTGIFKAKDFRKTMKIG